MSLFEKGSVYEQPSVYNQGGGGGGCSGSDTTIDLLGRTYKTIGLGKLLVMDENLDAKFSGIYIGSANTNVASAWYYNNDETAHGVNGDRWGLLYNYKAVEIIIANLPTGWRVPTKDDLDVLNLVNPRQMNIFSDGHSNSLKFSAPGSGYCYDATSFHGVGIEFRMISTTDHPNYQDAKWCFFMNKGNTGGTSNFYKGFGCSVRLVKDLE